MAENLYTIKKHRFLWSTKHYPGEYSVQLQESGGSPVQAGRLRGLLRFAFYICQVRVVCLYYNTECTVLAYFATNHKFWCSYVLACLLFA